MNSPALAIATKPGFSFTAFRCSPSEDPIPPPSTMVNKLRHHEDGQEDDNQGYTGHRLKEYQRGLHHHHDQHPPRMNVHKRFIPPVPAALRNSKPLPLRNSEETGLQKARDRKSKVTSDYYEVYDTSDEETVDPRRAFPLYDYYSDEDSGVVIDDTEDDDDDGYGFDGEESVERAVAVRVPKRRTRL